MKAPNSFTISPAFGNKAPKLERVEHRVSNDDVEVFLILNKLKKQFVVRMTKKEAAELAIKLMTASEPEPKKPKFIPLTEQHAKDIVSSQPRKDLQN